MTHQRLTHQRRVATLVIGGALLLSGCDASSPAPTTDASADGQSSEAQAPEVQPSPSSAADAAFISSEPSAGSVKALPADAFMAGIARHCWRSFAGKIVANEPAEENDPFAGKPLVMHVRECSENGIRIPFHVGDDRSRTWVLTRIDSGIQLKHDHRHADGSSDVLTMYGGDSAGEGSASRQEFPADAESKALFESEGRAVSLTNVWAIEVQPGERFVYELSRPGRLFRVEFDLTSPVETPPDPWGAEQSK